MKDELGVGIVGYGFIGKVHAWAHRSLPFFYDPLPARTRLVGVCTATRESGEKAMAQAGFEFATTDVEELLGRRDIDIIHCCTPNDAHHDLLKRALEAGKHIYCDKPLTRTVEEAEEVAALVPQLGRLHRRDERGIGDACLRQSRPPEVIVMSSLSRRRSASS